MVSARALRILATARGTSLSTAFCVLECGVLFYLFARHGIDRPNDQTHIRFAGVPENPVST
jgi:hypothetical protein